MKRVISICLALWLSVTCCYALETHSEQTESSESTTLTEIQHEPIITAEPLPDYSTDIAIISTQLAEILLYQKFFCLVIAPVAFAIGLVYVIIKVVESLFTGGL